ncbi:hypothetical protein CDG81_21160 [Actinopolyspora erythraea]|uniref:CopG family transcriptional regulator n=1 Tax=Actinopolyspora erythraea TaxID=414996 RepID=A0A099D8W7_9ACTN|nr:hypothetical protein [Actinopolyspora erythraea]ASU81329.1 hypothetical protein CDG81_21160 [Actinopolyspora erythraea]KGI82558.1 hypothetical protein IL38_03720 [Actinopolyspora erythraea]
MVLGRAKIGRRQRADAEEQQPAEPDRELDSYLAALSPEADPETTGTGRSFGGSEVHQLRLPLMANERLKELAAAQGTSPSALARDWVLQHLQEIPEEPPRPAESPQPEWPSGEEQRPAHARPEEETGDVRDPGLYGDELYGDEGFPTEFQDNPPTPDEYPTAAFSERQESAPGDGGAAETDAEITIPHGQYRYY